MGFVRYLAVTEGEFSRWKPEQGRLAWMGCCLSPYGPDLMGIPECLPAGSILMLTDRVEPQGQDPQRLARQLREAARQLDAQAVVLDFQRPPDPVLNAMLQSLDLPCPLVVTPQYALDAGHGVLLPCPAACSLEKALAPWQGRRVWLEMALEQAVLTLTPQGCRRETACIDPLPEDPEDNTLFCRYRVETDTERARFLVYETRETWEQKLSAAEALGVEAAIGLWQEFGE